MDEPKYKTTFSAAIHAIEPTEDNILESKASLSNLINLLPADIKPEEDPDLLYIVANLAVPGVVNLNDDCLMPIDAIATYKKFEKKLCDIEHNRDHIAGYIVKAYLTDKNNNQISDEQALLLKEPFYISTIAILWKVANKKLCDFIVESSNPSNSNFGKLSLSFEVGFMDYDIGITGEDRNTFNSLETILSDNEEFGIYDKLLRKNGGTGSQTKKDNIVFRILKGNIIPLGQGIVSEPAAQVKGIEVILENKVEDPIVETVEQSCEENPRSLHEPTDMNQPAKITLSSEEFVSILKNTINQFISNNKIFNNLNKNSVSTSINTKSMKDLTELEASWDNLKDKPTQEVFASVRSVLADEIAKASEDFVKKQKEDEVKAAELLKEKELALAAQAELNVKLEALQGELKAIKEAAASAAKEDLYNQHMSLIDQTFDLESDELELIVADIRDLDEESFAKWFDKSKKLMKEKTKAFKEEKKKVVEKEPKEEEKEEKEEECSKSSVDFKQVLASATQVEKDINNDIELTAKTLLEKVRLAFAPEQKK